MNREASGGSFAIDLVAEDAEGETVIIENQLERSNHDHLGKLITYAAARSAKTAIWIVAEPRDEHVRTVSWLNDAGLAGFWLFKIEAIQIGDSIPAPSLTKIVGPAEEGPVARPPGANTTRDRARQAFFTQLLEYANRQTKLHLGVKAVGHPWLGRRVGGVSWIYGVRTNGTQVMLYIDRGAGHDEENDAVFQSLLAHRAEVEQAFGEALMWDAKENNRSRQLSLDITQGGWTNSETWPTAIEATVTTMIRFEVALKPYLREALAAGDVVASLADAEDEAELQASIADSDDARLPD